MDSMNDWQRVQHALHAPENRIPISWRRLGLAVWSEPEEDIPHARCIAGLPSYVGAEIEDAPVAELYPTVQQHLDHCYECGVQYAELLEVALAELNDALPPLHDLPAPDLSFLIPDQPA